MIHLIPNSFFLPHNHSVRSEIGPDYSLFGVILCVQTSPLSTLFGLSNFSKVKLRTSKTKLVFLCLSHAKREDGKTLERGDGG